jgi:hypothetical protein
MVPQENASNVRRNLAGEGQDGITYKRWVVEISPFGGWEKTPISETIQELSL